MKARIHISINDTLLRRLDELCVLRHFDDRSTMLEHLIREEWELRSGSTITPAEPAAPISYAAGPSPDKIVAEAAARTIAAARAAVKRRPPAA